MWCNQLRRWIGERVQEVRERERGRWKCEVEEKTIERETINRCEREREDVWERRRVWERIKIS